MLKVQEYLRKFQDWKLALSTLNEELGIKSTVSETDGRVILNYCQINSPKRDEIVRECRGLILDKDDNWNLVSRSFYRFFNYDEDPEYVKDFVWNNCISTVKADGSSINLHYYRGAWHITTRGSFGNGVINAGQYTWKDVFKLAMNVDYALLNTKYSYILELCSRYNKIVTDYPTPRIYLLSIFEGEKELDWYEVIYESGRTGFETPHDFVLADIDEVKTFIEGIANEDPTFEGLVLRDKNNVRYKVKSIPYLELHKAINNGLPSKLTLIKLILEEEADEFCTYFPDMKPLIISMKSTIDSSLLELETIYDLSEKIESQKDFSLFIINKTKLSSILFLSRKTGKTVKEIINKNPKMLIKLFTKFE